MNDPISAEEYFRGTLKVIAHWAEVDLSGEWETGLRGVIRSITDAAREVLSAHPVSPGAALAEPATVAADLDGGDARPNSGLDSRDRGHNETLIRQLREIATEFAIDNKTDCKQHVCWIAADTIARSSERTEQEAPKDASEQARLMYDALNKAYIEYAAYSCNGVNLFGDKKSIDAAQRAFHSHSVIERVQTNLRHWMEECGKLNAKLKQQGDVEHSLQYEIEGLILKRLHQNRIAGYTLEFSKELAALYFAFRPDKIMSNPDVVSEAKEGGQ